jgi:hypothetical protein
VNPLTANFSELYQRHLCRHSQLGINVWHFGALVGTYTALFQLAHLLFGSWWVVPVVVIPYLVVITPNLPLRLTCIVVAFLGLFFSVIVTVPPPWAWVDLMLLIVCYWLQNVSHRWYPIEFDMTRFKQKYRKGPALFVLLTLYELPIQLNYLAFPSTRRPEADLEERARAGLPSAAKRDDVTASACAPSAT